MPHNNIAEKLFNKKYSSVKLSDFARKSGIKEGALFQILNGIIKNPGIYTIAKIADALECSVDELIAEEVTDGQTKLTIELARSCITTTIDLLRQAKHKVSLDEFLRILKEVYTHSLNKKNKAVDVNFATQCIDQFLKCKNVKG